VVKHKASEVKWR